jgi:acyl-CoA synthetase (AMP-forming)/AMP-acid ligase II
VSGRIALLGARELTGTVAWHDGRTVSAGQLLADAAALAEQLPAHGQAVNLCVDRYLFAVALLAAVLRGQTSMMPPNTLGDTLRRLRRPGTETYALCDDLAVDCVGLPRQLVQRRPAATPLREAPPLGADFDAVCLLTSGSTGAAQPHHKTWAALQANIAAAARRLADLLGWPSLHGLNLVATVPAQHSYGIESSVLLALIGGAALDAGRPFYPADIAAALQRLTRPRALVTTPFHLKTLLLAGVDLPPTVLVLSATAPLSPQLAAAAESTTPVDSPSTAPTTTVSSNTDEKQPM